MRARNRWFVSDEMEKLLGDFLRKQRGERTYAKFSRRLGLPQSTLHRLENGSQSITLRGLQQIMRRLTCSLTDIFGANQVRRPPARKEN
jgi:transcriptional regulator with XRE-family HTH domain